MNLTEIIAQANHISDEDIEVAIASGYVNDAIAKINVHCKANYPFFDQDAPGTDYTAFTNTWQRTLLVPFVIGRIKQMDSSQFEYSDAYSEFMGNLEKFEQDVVIPDEYKAVVKPRYVLEDLSTSYWGW